MIILFEDYKTEMFDTVMALRQAVFVDEQGADSSAVADEFDKLPSTRFALNIDSDTKCAVATGRLTEYTDGCKLGRIAVLPSERGKGTGKKTVEFLCRAAEDMGAGHIYVNAQLHAVPFYEKLGFKPTGEDEITDIGITHLPMVKE